MLSVIRRRRPPETVWGALKNRPKGANFLRHIDFDLCALFSATSYQSAEWSLLERPSLLRAALQSGVTGRQLLDSRSGSGQRSWK